MKDHKLKISSLNCRGACLGNPVIHNVFRNTDVLLCQEIKIGGDLPKVNAKVKEMEKIFKAKIFMSDIATNVRLVTIMKEKLNKDVIKFKEVETGRATYLSIKNKDYK